MYVKELTSNIEIEILFHQASKYNHRNSKNYERVDRISNFIKFYVLYNEDTPVAFSAIYKYDDTCVRVLDSTFYFPDRRIKGGEYYSTASDYFLPHMTEYSIKENMTPFFSIQSDRPHRRSMKRIVQNFNEKNTYQYTVLDGYHWTCKGKPNSENKRCWQTVAVCGDYTAVLRSLSKSL